MIFRSVPRVNGLEEPPGRRLEQGDPGTGPLREDRRGEPVEEQVPRVRRVTEGMYSVPRTCPRTASAMSPPPSSPVTVTLSPIRRFLTGTATKHAPALEENSSRKSATREEADRPVTTVPPVAPPGQRLLRNRRTPRPGIAGPAPRRFRSARTTRTTRGRGRPAPPSGNIRLRRRRTAPRPFLSRIPSPARGACRASSPPRLA